jgi:hypothetical protein
MNGRGLVSLVAATVISVAGGVALVRSLQDSYYSGLPHVTYLVNGEEVITRRFKTNEELNQYMESEAGKKEAEYYSKLNSRKKR